ncbi:apolipoprotein N-acyltransferase [Microbacterium sp. T2.11-28]|uniref:apolipoprotein N-acyltransferase n=1 Tax=Microbacterium sp. T2.11-28 TaxID=3041169 RepID=UPI0024772E4C|nr:apolipoprotein N-acyltransferase [Microbacterium sp. T2.11-28]CAI9385804.1 Apolipoprotein N-acyltransferase [Microbacterium sp. T2.11-28]
MASPVPDSARPLLPLWSAILVAIGGGVVLDLAFPDIGWWPLAFVGVAASLVSLIGRSAWGAVAVGAAFAASFYLVHIVWISRYLGPVPWFALAGVETVLSAVGAVALAWAYRWLPRLAPGRPLVRLLALPALVAGLWSARELWLGSWPYTGFPWGRLGMSQAESPLAHVASWTGVTGLGFLMVFLTAAVIELVRSGAWRRPLRVVPAVVVAVVLLATPLFPTSDAGTMRVGAVQGNGPAGYFDEREPYAVLQAQLDATAALAGEDLDVLLWPEGGIDADPTANDSVARVLDGLSASFDAPLIVNAATQRGEDTFNTSMLWEAGADNPVAFHDKSNPVPMGEYVPDRWFYEMLAPDLVGLIQREYTPGTNAPFFDVGGIGVGLAICFDVIYDDVIWEGARDGAQVYMFQTNNADFRDTDENLQQLSFARMRAIETGRSVVNLSTVGTSQVIAPDGTTIDALPAGTAGALLTDVPLRSGLTPAVVLGGAVQTLLGWGSLAALLVAGLLVRLRRRTTTTPAPEGAGVVEGQRG